MAHVTIHVVTRKTAIGPAAPRAPLAIDVTDCRVPGTPVLKTGELNMFNNSASHPQVSDTYMYSLFYYRSIRRYSCTTLCSLQMYVYIIHLVQDWF